MPDLSTFPPTNKAQLDRIEQRGCGNPDCDHHHKIGEDAIYLNPLCHPDAGISVSYLHGELGFECKLCRKPICRIRVANE